MVRAALEEVGYPGTHHHVRARTRPPARRQAAVAREGIHRGPLPKIKLELIVDDADAETIAETIAENARTGAVGDGKIWVSAIDSIMRVRTGETGEIAI